MKLGPVEKLVATLARSITTAQMNEMLEKSTEFEPWVKGQVSSPVEMLVKLRRKRSTNLEFLKTLLELLENVSDARPLFETVHKFIESHPDIDDGFASVQCNGGPLLRSASKQLMKAFNSYLLQMSQKLHPSDFEIIKAISPLQDGPKDGIDTGQKLFHLLKDSGRISPHDTELLEDIFTHMELVEPLNVLQEYKETFLRPDRQPSAPPVPARSHQSAYPTPHPYPYDHAPINTSYHSQSPPLHTGMSHVPRTGAVPQPLHSRPADSRYDTSPRSQYPSQSPATTSLHSAYHQYSSHQTGSSVAPASTERGGEESQQPTDPSQSVSSTQLSSRVRHFQTQISQTPSLLPSSVPLQQSLPSLTPPPTHLHPPPPNAPPYPPLPSASTTHPTPSAPPEPHTNPAHLHPPPPNAPPYPPLPSASTTHPTPSAPPEPHTNPAHSFPEAVSAQSTGNNWSFPHQVHPPPTTFVGPSLPHNPPNYSHNPATSAFSLPHASVNNNKLLIKRSREMGELPPSQQPWIQHNPNQPCPQRSVFFQGDIRASVGGPRDNCPSINQQAWSQQELNAQNNRDHRLVGNAIALGMPPLPTNATSHLAQSSSPDDQSRHFCPPPPTPPRFTQRSLLVPGTCSTPPQFLPPQSHLSHTNPPPNTLNSQFVSPNSSYGSSSFNSSSPSAPNSSASGSVLVTSHDPSTPSLVDRHEAANLSSSFAAITEESTGEGGGDEKSKSSESESCPQSGVGKKRGRENEESSRESSSSSSSEEEEEKSSKRLRTEQSSTAPSGGSSISSFLSRFVPFSWGKKKTPTETESDSESEEYEDTQ